MSLTDFTKYSNLQVHPCGCKWQHFLLLSDWVLFHELSPHPCQTGIIKNTGDWCHWGCGEGSPLRCVPSLLPGRPRRGPVLWLTDPHPLLTARGPVGCTGRAVLPEHLLCTAQWALQPTGWTQGLTHAGASCAHVTRCPLLPEWTPAASPLDSPLSPLGTRSRDGGLGPFPGQTASSPHGLQHTCCSPASGSSF